MPGIDETRQFVPLRIAVLTAAVLFGFTEAGFRMLSPDWFGFLLAVTAMPTTPAPQPNAQSARMLEPGQTRKEIRILQ